MYEASRCGREHPFRSPHLRLRKGLPGFATAPPDELRYLKERHGEKIVAFEAETETLLGSLSLYPDRDVGGHFFRLAGIDTGHEHRDTDIDASLLEEAAVTSGNTGCRG